jgi:fatty acid desaturase
VAPDFEEILSMFSDVTVQPQASVSDLLPSINPTQILSPTELTVLNLRSNWKGLRQLMGHLTVMGVSGYLWGANLGHWPLALPALLIYGFSLAAMFAPLHEGAHRTAFASNRLNDGVSWFAGLLSFYNSTFYRRYHKWHHRYTQISNQDPELSPPKPTTRTAYLLEISGVPWWIGKVRSHVRVALGQLEDCPFISAASQADVIRSTQLQLAVYGAAIGVSIAVGQPWFVLYWLLPLAVGQPILRAILLAEHTGCTYDNNPLTNTRTTLTLWPVQFLMWNMPFHTEHHLYASIPFHALPAAHQQLHAYFLHVDAGYLKVNRDLISALGAAHP